MLAERVACGLPAVATDVGDSALIVGDSGLVVPRKNPPAFAAAIRSLSGESAAARVAGGFRARAHIIENFAMPQVARRYAELYASLLRATP